MRVSYAIVTTFLMCDRRHSLREQLQLSNSTKSVKRTEISAAKLVSVYETSAPLGPLTAMELSNRALIAFSVRSSQCPDIRCILPPVMDVLVQGCTCRVLQVDPPTKFRIEVDQNHIERLPRACARFRYPSRSVCPCLMLTKKDSAKMCNVHEGLTVTA